MHPSKATYSRNTTSIWSITYTVRIVQISTFLWDQYQLATQPPSFLYMSDAIRGPSYDDNEPDRKMTVDEAADYAQGNAQLRFNRVLFVTFSPIFLLMKGGVQIHPSFQPLITPFLSLTMANRQHSSDGLGWCRWRQHVWCVKEQATSNKHRLLVSKYMSMFS